MASHGGAQSEKGQRDREDDTPEARLASISDAKVRRAAGDLFPFTPRPLEQVNSEVGALGKPEVPEVGHDSLASAVSAVELAHDMRSPLTAILFLVEALRLGRSGPLTELQEHQLGIVYSAVLSLSCMAEDVTELAHLRGQLATEQASAFSIGEVLTSVVDAVRPMIDESRVSLRIRLPETDHRIGYSVALSRVLLNLTTNAVRFTERGFVEIDATELAGSRIEFSVRDTGAGLRDEVVSQMAEPFQNGPPPGRLGASSNGLGLWICRRLVDAMNGTLQYETHPESGTRFYFELDLPPADAA